MKIDFCKRSIERVTVRKLNDKEAADDRSGSLIGVPGKDDEKNAEFQVRSGQQVITAYELPTDICRYDTTGFNVHHRNDKNNDEGISQSGHSRDRRPDLLQYKQGLGTIDPSGIPLMTDTISGEKADDRC